MTRVLFLLLLLLSGSIQAADTNIVVVFDTSGSMNEKMKQQTSGVLPQTRIDVAKKVLSSVLGGLPSSTNIGVVSFNGWVYEFGEVDNVRLSTAIMNERPNGGTPLWQYIKIGADKLLEVRKKNNNSGSYKLLVVTDGEASDKYLSDRGSNGIGYLQDIKNRGIIIDAIGLDMGEGHSLKSQVNGTYMAGDNPTSLQRAVEQSVAEATFKDTVGDSDFEAVASLPEEFAVSIVQAMSLYENHPVGSPPPEVVVAADGTITVAQQPKAVEPQGSFCLATTSLLVVVGCSGGVYLMIALMKDRIRGKL